MLANGTIGCDSQKSTLMLIGQIIGLNSGMKIILLVVTARAAQLLESSLTLRLVIRDANSPTPVVLVAAQRVCRSTQRDQLSMRAGEVVVDHL